MTAGNPRIWLHFPSIRHVGCEGVLILDSDSRGNSHIIVVDGAKSQIDYVEKLVEKADSAGKDFHVIWVASHFHQDHVGEGHRLLDNGPVERHLLELWCPLDLLRPWPHEIKTVFKELGGKLERLRRNSQRRMPPLLRFPNVEQLHTLWKHDGTEVTLIGSPAPGERPKHKHKRENARSLVVICGCATGLGPRSAYPFSAVLPGDAEKATWASLFGVIERFFDMKEQFPAAIFKLAHHGASDTNREEVLINFMGTDVARRGNQLAVRILNAKRDPRGMLDVNKVLQKLNLRLWNTRTAGDLWIRLQRDQPVVRAKVNQDPSLDLPSFFKV